MASAAGIETVKEVQDDNERNRMLHEIRGYIQKCEEIYHDIQADKPRRDKPDPTLAILASLEFEVNARLDHGNSKLEAILKKAEAIDRIDAKAFETIAATAFSLPQDLTSIAMKSLKIAIKLHAEKEAIDYSQLSHDLRTLISKSIEKGGNTNTQSKEEAYQYYQNVISIIQRAEKNTYPEMETLWLMTKAWNCGVHFISAKEYEFAEKWCVMAMKLLEQLGPLKTNYDTHMASVFADLLEKKEHRSTVQIQMEE
eukprot:gene72-669_t